MELMKNFSKSFPELEISISNMIRKLSAGENLTAQEAEAVMEGIMSGSSTPAQVAGILIALKMKGESEEEISAFAEVMRKHAVKIHPKAERLVDTCGTGGDSSHTFNVSTTAALIAAGAGVGIAKHGNRSVSSSCGSADVLEELGVKILQPPAVERCIDEVGFGFMFAPYFHPAMKNVAPIRKELGVRTVFNILGPLTNPAGAEAQVLGVFDAVLAPKIARVLALLGSRHALVVHSEGIDEIGLGKTDVYEVNGKDAAHFVLDAAKLGFENRKIPTSHSKEESAALVLEVLDGKKGAARDVAVLNAAAAVYVSGKADSIAEGMELAEKSVDSGKALHVLQKLREFTGEN